MENINIKCENTFDWDDINVGNHYLDHSENFFGSKHKLRSKQDGLKLHNEESEKVKLNDSSHKEQDAKISTSGNEENLEVKKESAVNLVQMWTDKKKMVTASKGAIPKNTPRTPKAYKVIDYYKKKKEEAERLRAEEERSKRVFHPKPMPNFNYYHEKLEKQMVVHTITVPITPEVLKHSRSIKQRSEKKPAELKQKEQVPKFESRPPSVLKVKPFFPERKHTTNEQRPFNLPMERRLQERKQYNEALKQNFKEKQIQKPSYVLQTCRNDDCH
ncbi:pleckstrin homology and FYVE domain containing family member rush hour isoform 3-T4 [Glossina fuscipes fuscipes]